MAGPAARWWLLAGWLAALALLATWSVLNLRPGTDLSQFLPRGSSQQDEVLLAQVRSGVAARTLLLRIGGPDAPAAQTALAAASRALADALRGQPDVVHVHNGALAADATDTDAVLFRYRYLIGPSGACAESLDPPALRAALEQRLEELASGLALLDKQHLAADPTACYRALLRSLVPRQAPARRHGVWLAPDGRHALLVVLTGARASDITAQRKIVAGIEQTFAALPEATGLTLELAGPGYFAVGSEARIKTETTLLSSIAGGVVALILLAAFRSVRLMLLGLLPLLTGVLTGVLVVALLYGQVHGITLALGVTLLGVALDYPVHVFAHAAGSGRADQAAANRSVWHSLLLGMITTVLGYAALAFASFEGLSQLGILAAVGLATAALSARYLLPPLLPSNYRLPPRLWLTALDRRVPRMSVRAGLWLLSAGLAVLVLTGLTAGSPWETDIRRLSTVPQHELLKDREIRAQLGAPDVARLLCVVAPDQATVLERLEAAEPDLTALVDRGLIGGFDSATRWLPSPATQRTRQVALPDRASLAAALASANAGLGFRLERLTPFLDDVGASRDLPPLRADDLSQSLVGTRLAMLLQPLGAQWLGLVPLSEVADDEAAAEALRSLAARHGLAYLDLRQGTAALLAGFFAATLDRLAVVALVILLTLALALRDSARLARILLPIGIALVITFQVVLWVQGAVNLFHLVSLLLVAGLAIDYGLFLSRPAADAADRRRTLFSVSVGAASSFAMFAMLAISAIPALTAIGLTVAVGILSAYASALLLARPPAQEPDVGH